MKKAILLFVLLLTMSFTFASNGLVEKSSVLSDTIEFTQVSSEENMILNQADFNALAPNAIWDCYYIGDGWWLCVRRAQLQQA